MKGDKESRLKEMLEKSNGRLRAKEERVFRYLLDNEYRLQEISISEIAEKADVSKATVVRFCKGLDFNGFKDFKVYYEAGKGMRFSSVPLVTADDGALKILNAMKEGVGCALERTFSEENTALLEEIVEKIKEAGEITIAASDEALECGEKLKSTIEKKYPKKKVFLNGDEAKTASCTILLSFSGNDKRVMGYLTNCVLSGGNAYVFTAGSDSIASKAATGAFILADTAVYSRDEYMLTQIVLSTVISAIEIMLD